LRKFLKNKFEQLTGSKLYRNSLPRGTSLTHDIQRLSSLSLKEIWDIGAHQGETALYFAKSFHQSTIRSFEPVSSNYNLLIQNCRKLENFHAHNFALGEENKKTKIFLQGASVIHSLRDDLNKPSAEDSKSEDVEVKTIDYVINDFKTASIDLLKIDVEGYEIEVLNGAYKSLAEKKINLIYLETGLDDRFNSIKSLIDFLKPIGYLPFAFYEQTAHWTGKQNLWYWNTLFAKEELL
jgi:FkbM family methyltransferase